jgi:hypothetical protein
MEALNLKKLQKMYFFTTAGELIESFEILMQLLLITLNGKSD